MAVPKYVFFQGRVVPYSDVKVGVLTHALNYGTAVFGGLRAYWNEDENSYSCFVLRTISSVFCSPRNCFAWNCRTPPMKWSNGLLELIRTEGHKEDLYVRPLAFYSDEIIGVKLHDLHPEVSMVVLPFGNYISNEDVCTSPFHRGAGSMTTAFQRAAKSRVPYVNSAFTKTDALRAGFDRSHRAQQ